MRLRDDLCLSNSVLLRVSALSPSQISFAGEERPRVGSVTVSVSRGCVQSDLLL